MTFVLYTNSLSAHQLPLAREIIKRVGADNFRYIYTGDNLQGGNQEVDSSESWIIKEENSSVDLHLQPTPKTWLESADVLLVGGLRPIDLLERRSAKGLRNFYQSERWFKPIPVDLKIPLFTFTSHLHLLIPGVLRMLHPHYRKMAKRFIHLMTDDPNFITLPIGPWSKKDFIRLGVRSDKMLDWGYFVEPSKFSRVERVEHGEVKVLYVGRLLKLKHIDTIIRAIAHLNSQPQPSPSTSSSPCSPRSPWQKPYTLTIVGDGPEKSHLQELASTIHLQPSPDSPCSTRSPRLINFHPSVPIAEVRPLMRSHDVLVFSSDATDGWGAVVSEALSEGTPVIGTYETGASAALLPDSQLFHCGNYKELAKKLSTVHLHLSPSPFLPPAYTPSGAVARLFKEIV